MGKRGVIEPGDAREGFMLFAVLLVLLVLRVWNRTTVTPRPGG